MSMAETPSVSRWSSRNFQAASRLALPLAPLLMPVDEEGSLEDDDDDVPSRTLTSCVFSSVVAVDIALDGISEQVRLSLCDDTNAPARGKSESR